MIIASSDTVGATLDSPLLDAERWQEPAVQQAFRRALHLLVHKAVLVEVERGIYRVDLWVYMVDDLVRESINSESAFVIKRTKSMHTRI